jgi:hypothetical protein
MTTKYPPNAPVYPTQKPSVIVPHPSALKPLHTERLILRPLRIDDDEDAAAMFEIRRRQDVIDWMYGLTLAISLPIPTPYFVGEAGFAIFSIGRTDGLMTNIIV